MMKNKDFNASATVEAAFILPIFVFAIFAVLWLLFFLYARIKLEADLNRAAVEVSEVLVVMGEKDSVGMKDEILLKHIKDYPYYGIVEKEIEIDHGAVYATASLRANVIYGGISGLFTRGMNSAKSSAVMKCWNCPKIKRIISIIMQENES